MIGVKRGFTILELLVGLAVSSVVMTAITMVFGHATNVQRQQRVRNRLGQDAAIFERQFNTEMRIVGMGRPRSTRLGTTARLDIAYVKLPGATAFTPVTSPTTLTANSGSLAVSAVMIVADVPRPDSNSETFGLLGDRPVGANRVAFINDHTGTCAPTTPATCNAGGDASLLYPGGPGSDCSSALDRGCAWAGKRLRPNDVFQIVVGDGTYANVQVGSALSSSASPGAGGDQVALNLNSGGTHPYPAVWPNTALGDAPIDVRGQGFVTSMDRIAYRFCPGPLRNLADPPVNSGPECDGTRSSPNESRVIERRQCWGPVVAESSTWTSYSTPEIQPGTCTAWEVVLRNVESMEIAFDDFSSNDLPRQIEYRVQLNERYGQGAATDVKHFVRGAARMRNVR
jgi:prepilin-type N-terminal cleavage/methylation domain-containing protein